MGTADGAAEESKDGSDAPEECPSDGGEEGASPSAIWLEDKFDGIRAQLHRSHERVEIFTRDLKRITEQFPEITAAAALMKDEVILDGEIIAYAEDKRLTFHDLQKRLGRRDQGDLFVGSDITVRYVVFDILWHNGSGLLREPLEVRREHLNELDSAGRTPAHWRDDGSVRR